MPSNNPEVKRRNSRKYAERHPERVRAYMRKYQRQRYAKKKEEILAYQRAWRAQDRLRNPRKVYEKQLRKKYGIGFAEYDAMLERQKGVCAICSVTPTRFLFVDHDHITDALRGLLCLRCNTLVGYLEKCAEHLTRAHAYIANPPALR